LKHKTPLSGNNTVGAEAKKVCVMVYTAALDFIFSEEHVGDAFSHWELPSCLGAPVISLYQLQIVAAHCKCMAG
jgi:hypothetical protein